MALDPLRYSVVWFAPLEIEARAAACMLDHRHDGYFAVGPSDDYVFQAGDICGYNVIIASFPAGHEYGTSAAAALASHVKTFFPNLYLGLLVGVAAGLPNLTHQPERDIRLGDVLVALSVDNKPAVIAYDLGKQRANDDFTLLRSGYVLSNTKTVLRSAIGTLKAEEPHSTKSFLPYYHAIEHMQHATGTFVDPGQEHDHYVVDGKIVQRRARPNTQRTRVWYGAIGSGDTLMKDPGRRDELQEKHGILGLEMEAAGIMNHIPVAVIRGVCDYGDEYKNKHWQPYAAAMAAAYAKAVLQRIPPRPVIMGNPSPKDSSSIVSGEVRNEVEVPQAFRQSTLSYLIQQIRAAHTTDWKNPLMYTPLKYLRAAASIPRGISNKVIIRDFLGRDLHFDLPLDWHDLRVILLPHFDTRERHGFEKIRNEEFLIVHCDRSEKRFKRIGPSNWDAEAQHGRKFHMFAIINQLQLRYQVCIVCQGRMKKFRTYLVCPNCGLFSLSAQHHHVLYLEQVYDEIFPPAERTFANYLGPSTDRWVSSMVNYIQTNELAVPSNTRTQHLVGILSSWESLKRKSEIRKIASMGGEIDQSRPSPLIEIARLPLAARKWAEKNLQPLVTESGNFLPHLREKQPREKNYPKVQRGSTDSSRRNPTFEREEIRHFKNIFIKEDAILYDAAAEGNVETIKNILTRLQASQISIDATWGFWGTPLVAAILHKSDTSVIEALLRAGADPLQPCGPLGGPLRAALIFQNPNAVEIMLGFILDSMKTALDADIQHLQGVLDKSLFNAIFFGHPQLMIMLLLYAGANPFAAVKPGLSAFALLISREFNEIHRESATDFLAEGYGRGLITSDEARLLVDAIYQRYVPVEGTPAWLDVCCRSINVGQAGLLEERVARRLASSTRKCFLSWTPFWRQPLSVVMEHSDEM